MLPLLISLTTSIGLAQDDVDVPSVLVVDFLVDDAARVREARLLHDAVDRRLRDDHLVHAMDDVAPFRFYDAHVYVAACPQGQHVDCAFVIGQRSDADWVVTGELRRDDVGRDAIRVSIVDIDRALVVLQVDLGWDGQDPTPLADGVAAMLDAVQAGVATDRVDIRIDPDNAPREDEVDPEEAAAAAAELAEVESEEGVVQRGEEATIAQRRVDRATLAELSERDVPPWRAVGLSADSWRRWQNSGRSLSDWRARARGRFGEVRLGATLVRIGQGPWVQRSEAWYAIDAVNLELSDQDVVLDQEPGLLRTWELQLGVGVAPWVDVMAYGGPALTTYRWRVQRIVQGDEPVIEPLQDKLVQTWIVGGRATFAPMPTFPARPTVSVGAEAWFGTTREKVIEVPTGIESLPRNRMVLVTASLGAEVDLGRWVQAWARVDGALPVAGRTGSQATVGGAGLSERPAPPDTVDVAHVGGAVGLTVRLRVRPKLGWPPRRSR